MTQEIKQEILYTIVENLLREIDELLHQQIKEAGEVHYLVHEHEDTYSDFDKEKIFGNLDNIQEKFQVVREYVRSANRCLQLLGLPELQANWIITLDENDKTKV